MQKISKKLLVGVFMAVVAVVGFAPSANAVTMSQTSVTGVISEKGTAIPNAEVAVECNGVMKMDVSDAHGSYLVNFTGSECPFGSTVKVTGEKNSKSGTKSGTVRGITTKLNVAIVNVEIPEFGWIGSIIAASAGLGAIAYTRRRQARHEIGI